MIIGVEVKDKTGINQILCFDFAEYYNNQKFYTYI
jgi:hypothetical protein